MEKLNLKTNADHIRSMTDDELATYLHHINANSYTKAVMLEWLQAVYVSDRIKIIIPNRHYEGDFTGMVTTWEEAYAKETDWLRANGYVTQEGIGETGKG